MSVQEQQLVYGFIGVRPSARPVVARLLELIAVEGVSLRATQAGERPDFWVAEGSDRESLCRARHEGVEHLLVIGGTVTGWLHHVALPLDRQQAASVMAELVARVSRERALRPRPAEVESRAQRCAKDVDVEVDRDTSAFSEYGSEFVLSPSELAMIEDDPPHVRAARQQAHLARRAASARTLAPVEPVSTWQQEWTGIPPVQVLVVADAANRSRTLPKGLRRMGFGVDVIEALPDALRAVAQHDYRIVFIDQIALGQHLVPWCKAFVTSRNQQGRVPGVVIVARRRAWWDRWRALRSGCIAWMKVPLDQRQLLVFLLKRGVERAPLRELS